MHSHYVDCQTPSLYPRLSRLDHHGRVLSRQESNKMKCSYYKRAWVKLVFGTISNIHLVFLSTLLKSRGPIPRCIGICSCQMVFFSWFRKKWAGLVQYREFGTCPRGIKICNRACQKPTKKLCRQERTFSWIISKSNSDKFGQKFIIDGYQTSYFGKLPVMCFLQKRRWLMKVYKTLLVIQNYGRLSWPVMHKICFLIGLEITRLIAGSESEKQKQ